MKPTLLHVYDPKCRPADQVQTWEALGTLQVADLVDVVHAATIGPTSYAAALQDHWEVPGDLLVCEQDIVPRVWHLIELLDCPEDFCTWDYMLANGVAWSSKPEWFGAGLVKYGPSARAYVVERPQVPQMTWKGMPARLRWRLPPFHVHRPLVLHNHRGG